VFGGQVRAYLARLDDKLEGTHGLGHGRIVVLSKVPRSLLLLGRLRDLERERHVSEAQVLGGDEASQEDVDALTHAERHRYDTVGAGLTVQHADKVRQVVEHTQVMLDHNHEPIAMFDIIELMITPMHVVSLSLSLSLSLSFSPVQVSVRYYVRLRVEEASDNARSLEALLHIEVRRRLIKHVDVRISNGDDRNRKALQLSSRKISRVSVENRHEV